GDIKLYRGQCGSPNSVQPIGANLKGVLDYFQGGHPETVCAAPDGRASGFVDDYSLSTGQHDWIDTLAFYRWFGDDLRAMASNDAASGDTRLQSKYNYIRNYEYDGV